MSECENVQFNCHKMLHTYIQIYISNFINKDMQMDSQQEEQLQQFQQHEHSVYQLQHYLLLQNQSQSNSQYHHPNQSTRIVRRIFQNYSSLMRNITIMKAFLDSYGKKLQSQCEIESSMPEQGGGMIIKRIALVRQGEQKEQILSIINKLKLMILKATYKKSTRLQHLNTTYVNHLKQIIMIQDRNTENIALNNIIYPHILRHHIILQALSIIQQFFDVIRLQKIRQYKHCPLQFLNSLQQLKQKVFFFINLHTESLLFVHRQYIGSNQALMFCPIVQDDGCLKISQAYLNLLNYQNPSWMKFQLYIEVFHNQTSNNLPVFYSKMINQKQSLGLNKHKDLKHNLRQEMQNLQTLINKIKLIRKYVFIKLIYNYLSHIFSKPICQPIQINIHNKFTVVISQRNVFQYEQHATNIKLPTFHPQLIINLMTLLSDDKNITKNKSFIQNNLNKTMQCIVFKLISQKNGSRVSWPLQSGSLGQFYYEYNSQRIIGRHQLKGFYKNY